MRTPGRSTSAITLRENPWHHVGALDDDVGRGEFDHGGAHRLDRDKGDIPGPAAGRVEYLAGGIVGDEFDANAQPPAELAREIGRDALGLAGRGSACASTELPRLMAARNFPVGARSLSASATAAAGIPPATAAASKIVCMMDMVVSV